MSDDVQEKVQDMANALGTSLIDRLSGYLKDEADTEFLKEMALELAGLQVQAMTAATQEQKKAAREDIGFIHARIDTFVARQAIKFHSEGQAIFKEVLGVVADVVTVLAHAALAAIVPA